MHKRLPRLHASIPAVTLELIEQVASGVASNSVKTKTFPLVSLDSFVTNQKRHQIDEMFANDGLDTTLQAPSRPSFCPLCPRAFSPTGDGSPCHFDIVSSNDAAILGRGLKRANLVCATRRKRWRTLSLLRQYRDSSQVWASFLLCDVMRESRPLVMNKSPSPHA